MKSMEGASDLEAFLKRDRWFVAIGLAGATAIAWIYLIVAATKMDGMTVESLVMPVVSKRPVCPTLIGSWWACESWRDCGRSCPLKLRGHYLVGSAKT
jgi:hypothetical protein